MVDSRVFDKCLFKGTQGGGIFFLGVGVTDCDGNSIVLSLNDLFDIVDEADEIEFVVDAVEQGVKNSSMSGWVVGAMRDIICSC